MKKKPSTPTNRGGARFFVNQKEGPQRIETSGPCAVLEECRSCPLIEAPYRAQLQTKTEGFLELLRSQKEFADVPVKPLFPAPKYLGYRHTAKLVFAEQQRREGPRSRGKDDGEGRFVTLGLYAPGTHTVVNIRECPVQNPLINSITAQVCLLVKERGLSIYREPRGLLHKPRGQEPPQVDGLLRYLIVRTNAAQSQALVTFVTFNEAQTGPLKQLARELAQRIPQVVGVLRHVNATRGNEIFSPQNAAETPNEDVLTGNAQLSESANGLSLRVSTGSFLQANPMVAHHMYQRMVEILNPSLADKALDLYCGVGAIGLSLARHCSQVVGIEESVSSSEDARYNARANKCDDRMTVITARAEDAFAQLPYPLPFAPTVVSTNPSRRGMATGVIEALCGMGPRAIGYMSCDASSLIRDLGHFQENGFVPRFIELYDMFPGTPHFELLCLLTQSNKSSPG